MRSTSTSEGGCGTFHAPTKSPGVSMGAGMSVGTSSEFSNRVASDSRHGAGQVLTVSQA